MTLGKIQELLLNLREVIDEFNKNCMPDGFFICEEPNGILIITDEETNTQTPVSQEFMRKTKLTRKEVMFLFKKNRF
ncbi:hypothetical protein [Pasteurella multocida]|uniref:hypothetical protein n=1 Tax=Pasteurella multocida TaxID=747 RepID=UPI0039FDC0DC